MVERMNTKRESKKLFSAHLLRGGNILKLKQLHVNGIMFVSCLYYF